jgi:hypothetical protein
MESLEWAPSHDISGDVTRRRMATVAVKGLTLLIFNCILFYVIVKHFELLHRKSAI